MIYECKTDKIQVDFKKSTPQTRRNMFLNFILFLPLYQGQLPIFPQSFTKYL